MPAFARARLVRRRQPLRDDVLSAELAGGSKGSSCQIAMGDFCSADLRSASGRLGKSSPSSLSRWNAQAWARDVTEEIAREIIEPSEPLDSVGPRLVQPVGDLLPVAENTTENRQHPRGASCKGKARSKARGAAPSRSAEGPLGPFFDLAKM